MVILCVHPHRRLALLLPMGCDEHKRYTHMHVQMAFEALTKNHQAVQKGRGQGK